MEQLDLFKPQTAIVPRAQLLAMPQVLKVLDCVEAGILKASSGKPVKDYDFQSLLKEVGQALQWIVRDVGYSIKGNDDWKYIVTRSAELLRQYYDTFTIADFRLAFELAVAGELAAYLPKDKQGQPDTGHYQQFGGDYICKILNAYKQRRAWALKRAEDAGPKPELPPIPDREQQINARRMKGELIMAVLEFKYTGQMPELSPIQELRFYEILASVGLVDEIEVTDAERKAILSQSFYEYAAAGMVGDLNRLKKEGESADELQGRAYRLARRKGLERAFRDIVESEIQIIDYVWK